MLSLDLQSLGCRSLKTCFIHRKSTDNSQTQRELNFYFSSREFNVSIIYCAVIMAVAVFLLTGLVLIFPNDFSLPLKFYIIFLPFEGFSFNWFLNYAFQLVNILAATVFYVSYCCIISILMHHSCWVVDSAVLCVQKLQESLIQEDIDFMNIRQELREVINQSLTIISWLNVARRVLRLSFLFEFSLMSSILCMCIFTFLSSPNESMLVLAAAMIALSQFSVYCWMGSMVNSRIEIFSSAIYNVRWYKMHSA